MEFKTDIQIAQEAVMDNITDVAKAAGVSDGDIVSVKAENERGIKKSFTYTDIITKTIKIDYCAPLAFKDIKKAEVKTVQMGCKKYKILSLIPPHKGVDGFHSENVGNLMLGKQTIVACTPFGVLKMLQHENIDLCGKNAVVLGRSNIVGKPMSMLLLKENCTVTICHSKTVELEEVCKKADILVAAIGKPKFVTKDMIKKDAIIIDVGINRTSEGLVGDVDFENVAPKCSFITPVPGGVGPMTITMLMQNTLTAATEAARA